MESGSRSEPRSPNSGHGTIWATDILCRPAHYFCLFVFCFSFELAIRFYSLGDSTLQSRFLGPMEMWGNLEIILVFMFLQRKSAGSE